MAILEIARVNLLRVVRDRANLFFVFLMPLLIILAVGAVFGGGGTSRLGVVRTDALTVTGETIGDRIAGAEVKDRSVVRTVDAPYSETGGIAVLFGNLAQAGAVVKTAYSLMSARCLTPAAEQALIREKAGAALRRLGDFRPFRLEPPIAVDVDFKHRLPAEILGMQRFAERTHGYGIRYVAQDMEEASRFLVFVLGYNATLV